MIQDQRVMAAVAKIIQRSERQEDAHKLVGTYVDIGLLPQLNSNNHQIFYGRRGTGKTHVMKVLASELSASTPNCVTYIDCRTLGSTSQFSDPNIPINRRCLSLFRDVFLEIYHGLLEHIVNNPSSNAEKALEEVDSLATIITEPIRINRDERVRYCQEEKDSETISQGANATLSIKDQNASLQSGIERGRAFGKTIDTELSVHYEDKVIFPELQRCLQRVLHLAEARLFLLIDEWSSLPVDIQPYLAEFLKRGLLPLNSATLKISALEHRSRFFEGGREDLLGFELGADIATAPDLDDYYVFDRNPEHVVNVYANVLMRHLSSELPTDFLKDIYGVNSTDTLISKMFTERATLIELSRASEGVVRDLINIFTQAFFNAQRRGRESIDKRAVIESARQWFEQDKAQYLDDSLQEILRKIVDEVIGRKKARSFLLPRKLERNPSIQRLFDARVLHHMQRGYADKDNPGVRYNIYAIDYGAYVDLIGTSREPQISLLPIEDEYDVDLVVPYDDKRSIRRILLDERMLK